MPDRNDAINAILVLKEIAATEQKFLTEFTEEGRSVTTDELRSHLNVIKELIASQGVLLALLMEDRLRTDDQIDEILKRFSE